MVKSSSPSSSLSKKGAKANSRAVAMHLLGFVGFVFPLANILAPSIFWFLRRSTDPQLDRVGREVLNFQISFTIYVFAGLLLSGIFIGLLILPAVIIAWVVFMILAAVKAGCGEDYKYPFTLNLISAQASPTSTASIAPVRQEIHDEPDSSSHQQFPDSYNSPDTHTAAMAERRSLAKLHSASAGVESDSTPEPLPAQTNATSSTVTNIETGPGDWDMEPKTAAIWRHVLGGSVLKSNRLLSVSRRGNNITAKLANGKVLSADISSIESVAKCSGGSNSIEYITMTCRAGSKNKVKFAVNDLQMPEEWWKELKEKIGCRKVASFTEKFEKVAVRAVAGLFFVTCPKCKVQGQASSEEIDKRYLGQKTQGTGYGNQRTTYNIYQVTTAYQCQACSHSWTSKREKREYSSGSRGFGMDAVN